LPGPGPRAHTNVDNDDNRTDEHDGCPDDDLADQHGPDARADGDSLRDIRDPSGE